MRGPDRRTLLGAAATAIAMPLIAALPARLAAEAGRLFIPPSSPMLYRRRLIRELPGGASFDVERRFSIRIDPVGRGFQITGEQAGVEVSAPASLERFAQIERERREASLFPINLDGQGLIFGSSAGRDEKLLDTVVEEARNRLAQMEVSVGDRAEIETYLRAIHQTASGLVTELPADIFAPTQNARSVRRELALPGGGSGQIQSHFQASTDPETGLMREASREVVSELAGDSRRILESWHLTPIA